MDDYAYAKSLSRELASERLEHEKTRAALDEARADLERVSKAAACLLAQSWFWAASSEMGRWPPAEIDALRDALDSLVRR